MTKLPEPACTVSPYEVNHIYWEAGHEQAGCGSSLFTETQMLQFRRDALEEAARVCDNAAKPEPLCGQTDEEFACSWCADAIRKLKDET